MGKWSGKTLVIDGVKFYLAAILTGGKVSGYVLQPEDEFDPPIHPSKTNDGGI